MNELDLHGVRFGEVERVVENFILMNQTEVPLIMTCGDSERMNELVKYVTRRLGCTTSMTRHGVITVLKV